MALTKSLKEIIAEDKTGLLSKHESWERVSLRDVATILNGYPFESRLFHATEGTPLIRIRDVLNGCTDTFFYGDFDNQYLVNSGELLVGMDGDFNCARWKSHPALLNQRVCKITVEESLYSEKLLEYALPEYLAAINAATSSVTVKHLSSRSIEDIELPLPPKNEQTRIVENLEELLSDLEAGVTELKAAQKKLGQYRQSLLKAAVEGELTAEWRIKNKPRETGAQLLVRIQAERRARWEAKQLAKFKEQGKTPLKEWRDKYPEPVKPAITNLPELPEGWVWASVEQLSVFITSGSRGWADYYSQSGAVFIRSQDINTDTLVLDSVAHVKPPATSEGVRTRVQKHDLLITITGANVAKCAVAEVDLEEAYISQHVALVRPVFEKLAGYLHLFLTSGVSGRKQLLDFAYGAGKPGLNLQQVASVVVPLPPENEMEQIVELVTSALCELVATQEALSISLAQSAAQRKNILKSAFSGQLVPQDPNDEPAGVLLERIRAERAMRTACRKPSRRKKRQEAAHD